MYPDKSKLIDSIREKDNEFRRLEEKHKRFEASLDELMKQTYLSPNQEMLKKEIKKQKLWTKDRMAEIIQEFLVKESSLTDESSSRKHIS